jgi:hypothetical protein
MNIHSDNIETLDIVLTDVLLKGENIAIPNLGYVELKTIAGKRTVLFKALKPNDLLMQSAADEEDHFSSILYKNITVPLKEWKVVSLPKLGIFHPLKKDDGSLRVSFTPSASLRRQLNGETEPATVNKTVEPAEVVKQEEQAVEATAPEKEKIYPVIVPAIPVEKKETVRELKAIGPRKEETSPKEVAVPKVMVAPKESESREQPAKRVSSTEEKKHSTSHESIRLRRMNKKNRMFLWVCVPVFLIIIAGIFILSRNKKEQEPVEDKSTVSSLNLPALANRHYGNSVFWVYIYEANRQKLTSPVNIPADVELIIPDLSQYNIDVKDSLEIRKAKIKSDLILRQR